MNQNSNYILNIILNIICYYSLDHIDNNIIRLQNDLNYSCFSIIIIKS